MNGRPIMWPGGGSEPVLGRPVCGWDNEICSYGKVVSLLSKSKLFISVTLQVYFNCIPLAIKPAFHGACFRRTVLIKAAQTNRFHDAYYLCI